MTTAEHRHEAPSLLRGATVVRLRAGTASPAYAHVAAQREAERIESLKQEAFRAGLHVGELRGDVAGFWRGWACGALAGVLAGAVLVAAALALGLQVPPLWG